MRARGRTNRSRHADHVGPYTVKQCVAEYLTWMERTGRVRRMLVTGPRRLSSRSSERSNARSSEPASYVTGYRRSRETPARIRGKKGKGPRFRVAADKDEDAVRRRRASANRTLTILKASLNMAWREGNIASDDAWRRVTPFEQADAARVRYLQIDEARRLISACEPEFRELVRTALATGARYSELANLRVGDFNPDAGTVHVRASKSGKGRHIVLAEEGIRRFGALLYWPGRCRMDARQAGRQQMAEVPSDPAYAGGVRSGRDSALGEFPHITAHVRESIDHGRGSAPCSGDEPWPFRHTDGRKALRSSCAGLCREGDTKGRTAFRYSTRDGRRSSARRLITLGSGQSEGIDHCGGRGRQLASEVLS